MSKGKAKRMLYYILREVTEHSAAWVEAESETEALEEAKEDASDLYWKFIDYDHKAAEYSVIDMQAPEGDLEEDLEEEEGEDLDDDED